MTEYDDGVYYDMPEKEYFNLPFLTNTGIKDINISTLDYWGKRHNWTSKTETVAFSRGSMMHCLMLEGEKVFDSRYMVRPEGMKFNTKDGRAWKEEHSEFNICTSDDHESTLRLMRMINHFGEYRKYFETGNAEVVFIWTEIVDGVKIKCAARCDKINTMGITDLKSFTNQQGRPLSECVAMSFANYKYYTQGYWYKRGLKAMHKLGLLSDIPNTFTFVFAQSDGIPNIMIREYARETNQIQNAYYRLGHNLCHMALNKYATCMGKFGWDNPWLDPKAGRAFIDDEMPVYMYKDEPTEEEG